MKWTGTAASLTFAAAWVLSEVRPRVWGSPRWNVEVWWCCGRVVVADDVDKTGGQASPGWGSLAASLPPAWWFNWYDGGGTSARLLIVPFWPLLVVAVATAAPAWRLDLVDRRRRGRAERGQCSKCGYDRRGIGAGSLCPECGAGARGASADAGRQQS